MTEKRKPTEEELRERIVRHALGLLENAEQLRDLKNSDRESGKIAVETREPGTP